MLLSETMAGTPNIKSELMETSYMPIELTETQSELVEKFTAAFYSAQSSEKCSYFLDDTSDIFEKLDDFPQPEECPNEDSDGADYLLDFLLSKDEESATSRYESCSTSTTSTYETCSTRTSSSYESNSTRTTHLSDSSSYRSSSTANSWYFVQSPSTRTSPASTYFTVLPDDAGYYPNNCAATTEEPPVVETYATPSSIEHSDMMKYNIIFDCDSALCDRNAFDSGDSVYSLPSCREADSETYPQNADPTSQSVQDCVISQAFAHDENSSASENLDSLDLSDIDLCETLSNSSFDIDNFASDICEDYEMNPGTMETNESFSPVVRQSTEFSEFLRNKPPQSLEYFKQLLSSVSSAAEDGFLSGSVLEQLLRKPSTIKRLEYFKQETTKDAYGHLLGNRTTNNNISSSSYLQENITSDELSNNQVVMDQKEALLLDDPLLSSSNVTMFPKRFKRYTSESQESKASTDCEENYTKTILQCKWENCYQMYESQASLVCHIEKSHVELKRGEEFTCFWLNCPRKTRPFNARYKLLIHMRVHSGEKPNKCPFNGCNKAFSRLENLKIHQRSHTGERPYLCQFSSCTKSFSNSSDRAKHQRTHFDTKPYACQVAGCAKKYTDPSSLRKHVKNHTYEEQMMLKKKTEEGYNNPSTTTPKKIFPVNKSKPRVVHSINLQKDNYTRATFCTLEHNYSNTFVPILEYVQNTPHSSISVKQDLKNKISEKRQRKIAQF